MAKNPACLDHLACLGKAHDVDVFILAECPASLSLDELNAIRKGIYRLEPNAVAKIHAITRLDSSQFIHRYTSLGREMAVWSMLVSAAKLEILLAGVHLASKFGGTTENAQALIASEIIEELNDIEDRRRHRNTVMIGDFNMHPYDPGMTNVIGMHSLMTRELAGRPERMHRQKPRRSFYNPMWGLFGDRTPGPPGSHHWRSSALSNTHWAIFDQVLLRPGLSESLRNVIILDSDGRHSLSSANGMPSSKYLSDHLPLLTVLDV